MAVPAEYFNETYLRDYFNRSLLNKKGGGRDNLSPEKFLEKHWSEFDTISQKCLDGSYHFSYYNEKLVLRGSQKLPRVLSIPSVRDRLVLGVLNDYLSAVFPECVNHEIPNNLIYQVDRYIHEHPQQEIAFLRTDFSDFYGTIHIRTLMKMLKARIKDKAILDLVFKAVTTPTVSGSAPKGLEGKRKQGIPQGLSISNILAAIYMMSFDEEFGKANAGVYIRYVDDILFLDVKTEDLQSRMIAEVKQRKLRLKLSKEKCRSGFIGADELDFIGYIIKDKIFIRQKNVTRFINRVAALSSKCRAGLNQPYQRPLFIKEDASYYSFYVEEFNRLISGFKYGNRLYGWMSYFQAINDVASLYGMDRIIRGRLLKELPEEVVSKVNSLVDTYYDIRRNGGEKLVTDFDSLTTIEQKRSFLLNKGRIDRNKTYTDEQIENNFDSYLDLIKRVSEQNIGAVS